MNESLANIAGKCMSRMLRDMANCHEAMVDLVADAHSLAPTGPVTMDLPMVNAQGARLLLLALSDRMYEHCDKGGE
jgi:hypothetical protein